MNTCEEAVSTPDGGVRFWKNSIVRTLVAFASVLMLAGFAVLLFFVRSTWTLLVLHYNVYFGVDILGAWWQAYILPVFSLFFFGGHLLLSWYFYQRRERIAAYLLLLAAVLLEFGTFVAISSIAFINY